MATTYKPAANALAVFGILLATLSQSVCVADLSKHNSVRGQVVSLPGFSFVTLYRFFCVSHSFRWHYSVRKFHSIIFWPPLRSKIAIASMCRPLATSNKVGARRFPKIVLQTFGIRPTGNAIDVGPTEGEAVGSGILATTLVSMPFVKEIAAFQILLFLLSSTPQRAGRLQDLHLMQLALMMVKPPIANVRNAIPWDRETVGRGILATRAILIFAKEDAAFETDTVLDCVVDHIYCYRVSVYVYIVRMYRTSLYPSRCSGTFSRCLI